MNAVTSDQLAKLLPTMTRAQVDSMLRAVLKLRTFEQRKAITLADRLRAGLWEFMHAVGFVTDGQASAVLARVGPVLAETAARIAAGMVRVSPLTVVFAEKRFVAVPGVGSWYDLAYDEEIAELPEPAVLLVSCDVMALYARQEKWLAKLNGGTDAGPQHHAEGSGG